MKKVGFFSSKSYDREFFNKERDSYSFDITYLDTRLTEETAPLCEGFDAVCVFVNDVLDKPVLNKLHQYGITHIALRCAGFNNVDLNEAKQLGIAVSRVPAYSPESVAEHTVALILTLNRKLHKAYNRVKEDNFSLDGLLGFNLFGKTAGIVGAGKIGACVAKILRGFGCEVLYSDQSAIPDLDDLGCKLVSFDEICESSNIISLHCPLTKDTYHLVDANSISHMQSGVMLINTSRGGLVDTDAVIKGLKNKKIGHLGLDVYEMESELFFEDLSNEIVLDDQFQRLLTFPNVLITGHQGFFTEEALLKIATTTLDNLDCHFNQCPLTNTFL